MKRQTKSRIRKMLTTAVLLLAMTFVQFAQGVALEVDAAEPSVVVSNFSQLQDALQKAEDGDIIGIDSQINCTEDIGDLDKHITIVRTAENAFLDFDSRVNVKIQNITLDGNEIEGSQPICMTSGDTTFEQVTFKNCSNTETGGAVWVYQGTAAFTNCLFDNNKAESGGHISVWSTGKMNLDNCILRNGYATKDGGGALFILNSSGLYNSVIENCTITNNFSERIGGGILNRGNIKIIDTMIYGNTASLGGADIANSDSSTIQIEKDIEQLQSLFSATNIRPVEWINDYNAETGESITFFTPSLENSFMKLIYEEIPKEEPDDGDDGDADEPSKPGEQEEPSIDENENSGSETDSSKAETESPDAPSDGNSDDSGSSGQDNTSEGQETDSGSTTDPSGSIEKDSDEDKIPEGESSSQDIFDAPSEDGETEQDTNAGGDANITTNSSSVTGDTVSTATDSNSSVTNDSHDSTFTTSDHTTDTSKTDNSRTTTSNDSHDSSVVNNYYTSDDSESSNVSGQPQVTVVNNIPSNNGQQSSEIQNNQNLEQNQVQQKSDNIRIEAHGANVLYEVADGVHSISINATGQETSEVVLKTNTTDSDLVPASADRQVVDWYEIAKVILLGAILLNLMWKRKEKD